MDARWTDEEMALAGVLEECLDAMERGEGDLDALAGRHPQAKEELRPLLEIAAELRERRALYPMPESFLRDLKERLRKAQAHR